MPDFSAVDIPYVNVTTCTVAMQKVPMQASTLYINLDLIFVEIAFTLVKVLVPTANSCFASESSEIGSWEGSR